MRHVILTCKNHPELRWSCKEIAFTDSPTGGYNGSRHLHFNGTPDGTGMFSDGSGLACTMSDKDGRIIAQECACLTSDLILAPEDVLVRGNMD